MSEQQLRQTLSALDISKMQFENITRQQELVRSSMEEHIRARETLTQYEKTASDEEILIPAGAGVFLHAKVADKSRCITNVGASVMIEKEIGEVVKILDEQLEDLQRAAKELGEQAEKISFAIEDLSRDAREQYTAMQQPAEAIKKK